jgi:hypothetical protein
MDNKYCQVIHEFDFAMSNTVGPTRVQDEPPRKASNI